MYQPVPARRKEPDSRLGPAGLRNQEPSIFRTNRAQLVPSKVEFSQSAGRGGDSLFAGMRIVAAEENMLQISYLHQSRKHRTICRQREIEEEAPQFRVDSVGIVRPKFRNNGKPGNSLSQKWNCSAGV